MAWYDNLLGRLSDYARSKITQLESFFAKGLGPQQANHFVKESSALKPENRKGVAPHEALQLWRAFNASRTDTLSALPTKRSQRLLKTMATPTTFKSGFNYRYLLDFEFQAVNRLTGETETFSNTLGIRRLDRWGKFLDLIQQRITNLSEASDEYENIYGLPGYDIIPGTVTIKGFYSTQYS